MKRNATQRMRRRRADSAPPRSRWRWTAFLLAAVVITAVAWTWQRTAWIREVRAALPSRPDVRGQPPDFVTRLTEAEARTEAGETLLEAVAELGRLYQANGYDAEASRCWQVLCARQPDEPRWWYYRAMLRLADSDDEEAAVALRETLTRAPGYAPARWQLGNLLFKTGDLAGAENEFRLRLGLLPRDPYARLGLARVALQARRTAEAKAQLEFVLKEAPHFSTAHNLYAEILAAEGDRAQASWHRWLGVETLRYTDPVDPWLEELQPWCYDYDRLCVAGSIESMRENRDRARSLFERAIALKPTDFDAYRLLAAMHFRQNESAHALALFETARSRLGEKLPVEWYAETSRAYRLLARPADAESVVREGLVRRGESAELLEALGLALADLQRHAEAVAAYRAALQRNPNDASINYNLAVSLLALHDLDEALAALDRSLRLQPTFPPTLLLRGRIELAAGHWAEAENYLRPLVEAHPENGDARQALAEWHGHMGEQAEQRGDRAGAERNYRDGLTLVPDDPALLARLRRL